MRTRRRGAGLTTVTRSFGLQAKQFVPDAVAGLRALISWELITSSTLPQQVKPRLVDPIVEFVLLRTNYTVGQLMEDPALLAEANRVLREKQLINDNFTQDLLLGTYHEEIEEVVTQTIVDDLLRDGDLNILALLRGDLLDATMERLAKKHPHLEIKRGFDEVLLRGRWAEDIEAALDEIDDCDEDNSHSAATSTGLPNSDTHPSEKEVS